MKRILSLFLVLCLVISCTVFSVSATSTGESNTSIINYFDYNDVDANYTVTVDSDTVYFPLPRTTYIRYVDLIIGTGQGFSSISAVCGSVTTPLNVIYLGNSVYRVYGELKGGRVAWDDKIGFKFGLDSGANLQFWQFHYSNDLYEIWPDIAGLWVQGVTSDVVYMADSSSPVTVTLNKGSDGTIPYYGQVYINNFRKYDYLDVYLQVNSAGLTSIGVQQGGSYIPFEISLFDSNQGAITSSSFDYGSVVDGEPYYSFDNSLNYQYVLVSIDLRTINRSSTAMPVIFFNGVVNPVSTQTITLKYVTGRLIVDNISTWSVWFGRVLSSLSNLDDSLLLGFGNVVDSVSSGFTTLTGNLSSWFTTQFSKFDQLISGSSGQQDQASDFNTSVDDQSSQFQEMTDVMTSVEQPDIGSVDMSVDGMVDTSAITLATTGISSALSNEIILRLLLMAMTFALVGFILYGKK